MGDAAVGEEERPLDLMGAVGGQEDVAAQSDGEDELELLRVSLDFGYASVVAATDGGEDADLPI
ncbi:hypothetical protein ACLOJK_027337 [Asimina triloba]